MTAPTKNVVDLPVAGTIVGTDKILMVDVDDTTEGPLGTVKIAEGTTLADLFAVLTSAGLVSATNNGIVYVNSGGAVTSGAGVTTDGTTITPTGGVYLGGTAAANLLDDYEEGTWTPTVYGSSTPGTYTPSSLTAYYTKIGNQVTVWAQFGFSSASGGDAELRMAGLPFSYKANSAFAGSIVMSNVNTTTSSPLATWIQATTTSAATVLYPLLSIDNGALEQVPTAGVSTSSVFSLTITYTVS